MRLTVLCTLATYLVYEEIVEAAYKFSDIDSRAIRYIAAADTWVLLCA